MKNQEIAAIFRKIADILEIKDENPFRIRAYRRAAQNIENLMEDAQVLVREDRLDIPGVGRDLAAKVKEIVDTGALEYFDRLLESIPSGLLEIMKIPGMGPKKTKLVYDKLKIDSVDKLEQAVKNHDLLKLFGVKEKTEENILRGIEIIRQARERMLLFDAMNAAREITGRLSVLKDVVEISEAGSLRRRKETIRDIDILVASDNARLIMDEFTGLDLAERILAKGPTKASILTKDNLQVDVRVVPVESYGAALCYFTGSKEHNIRIRDLAKKKGLKANEYGVFRESDGKKIAGKTEKEIYDCLGLSFVEPEMREDRGEIALAKEHHLPDLITLKDLKADTHLHSQWSDGNCAIEDMALACRGLGYEYMIISDHSQSLGVAGGLKEKDLFRQIEEIRRINKKLKNFRILCGAEVDIKSDGSLDFDDSLLKELDVVLAAIHSGFKQDRERMTQRIIKAMHNKFVNIIVHPFGRLIGERPAYELDFEKILEQAKKTNTALEINSYFKRLDLDDLRVKRAKEAQVKMVISTDSHAKEHLPWMQMGVFVARRGWLEKKDVLNCLPCEEFLKKIKK